VWRQRGRVVKELEQLRPRDLDAHAPQQVMATLFFHEASFSLWDLQITARISYV
jgi:hypothetical protein